MLHKKILPKPDILEKKKKSHALSRGKIIKTVHYS